METLLVPPPLRERLGDAGSDGLVNMFAGAHRMAAESFERRLAEEMAKMRLEMAGLKFEILKWAFLFWIGQLTAMAAILNLMLRDLR